MFERFRQADRNSTRVQAGLGLGLAIVRHIVELHGGAVRAESAGEGQGATFVVDLPYGEHRGIPRPEATSSVRARPRATLSDALQGIRVLVVDDSADTGELLALVLESQRAEVVAATEAREAFGVLEKSPPDVLVCDIAMPGMDGYDVIRQVRARPGDAGAGVQAVAVTAYAGPEDRERALAAGFDQYIVKPIDPTDFVKLIREMVERRG